MYLLLVWVLGLAPPLGLGAAGATGAAAVVFASCKIVELELKFYHLKVMHV